MAGLKTKIALAYKLFLNLFVRVFITLYHLPEGNNAKRESHAGDGSLIIFWAFMRQQELCNSSIEGREQPITFWAVVMILWSAFLSAAVQLENPHTAQVQYVKMLSTEQW